MKKTQAIEFPVDNASILFLSRIYPYHTNSFRFTITMTEEVCPVTLQKAVDRIWKRFPSVIAGFRQDFFRYMQVPADKAPRVLPDPGLLFPMTAEEVKNCCFRIFYAGRDISIEAFHALTDGYGAITTFTTLIAEYLYLMHGIAVPVSETRLDPDDIPKKQEVADSFLDHPHSKPAHLPSRYAYQLPRSAGSDWKVRVSSQRLDTKKLLDASHRHGVTLNSLLSAVLAWSVMDLQKQTQQKLRPVRLMVPADLRRLFSSKTLRNFSLYALPTMEVSDHDRPFPDFCRSFGQQLKEQLSKESLGKMIAYNVRTQNAWWFRRIPWTVKSTCMRIGYRFFGESNSSLTLTNLGRVQLPVEMQPYVENVQAFLTPRTGSPYGCAVLTYGDKVNINMSRFCENPELDRVFFEQLQAVMEQ